MDCSANCALDQRINYKAAPGLCGITGDGRRKGDTMQILEETPTEHKATTSDFEPIGAILPEVLHDIFQAALVASVNETVTPETRGCPLRWAA